MKARREEADGILLAGLGGLIRMILMLQREKRRMLKIAQEASWRSSSSGGGDRSWSVVEASNVEALSRCCQGLKADNVDGECEDKGSSGRKISALI